ncbi:hypothetical protein GCK32_007266 [Trichostrongylus colubriformis]|uniref:Uncharacterized protein n=1 Tax=Trichostrongylus colubriformis TaxID=6319 RepID=A0AAN8FNR2_TRICO
MFLVLIVLAVTIANICGESERCCFMPQTLKGTGSEKLHDKCITSIPKTNKNITAILNCDPDMELTFYSINECWVYDPTWDDDLASEALKEALKRNSTESDFKIYRKRYFKKDEVNATTMVQAVVQTLSDVRPYWEEKICFSSKKDLRTIPPYAYYGCNGIFFAKEKYDVLRVVCLYKEKRVNNKWHKYKNIELNLDN